MTITTVQASDAQSEIIESTGNGVCLYLLYWTENRIMRVPLYLHLGLTLTSNIIIFLKIGWLDDLTVDLFFMSSDINFTMYISPLICQLKALTQVPDFKFKRCLANHMEIEICYKKQDMRKYEMQQTGLYLRSWQWR